MIIGLTGPNASGKGEVSNFLQGLGYRYYSLSDIIREECRRRNLEPTRDNMIVLGNEFRKKFGAGIWAEKLVDKLSECDNSYNKHNAASKNKNCCKDKELSNCNEYNVTQENIVVDSIRHPDEVNQLRRLSNFRLICIDCNIKIRFERSLKRNRIGDPKTFEDFKCKEQLEMTKNKDSQQISETMKLADHIIDNSGSLKELGDKVRDWVRKLV